MHLVCESINLIYDSFYITTFLEVSRTIIRKSEELDVMGKKVSESFLQAMETPRSKNFLSTIRIPVKKKYSNSMTVSTKKTNWEKGKEK